jgi:hypothetical protein
VPSGFAEGTSTAQNSARPHRSPGADFFVLKLAPSREDVCVCLAVAVASL